MNLNLAGANGPQQRHGLHNPLAISLLEAGVNVHWYQRLVEPSTLNTTARSFHLGGRTWQILPRPLDLSRRPETTRS